jgi:hypothetical protein
MHYAADFDLWRRFAEHAELYSAKVLLGGFRMQARRKTALHMREYYEEVDRSLSVSGRARFFRKLVRNRLIRRGVAQWVRMSHAKMVVTYDISARRWVPG